MPPTTSNTITIRRAILADAAAIADIYNEAILTTTATFDTEPKTIEDREQWLRAHDERHPVLVATVDDLVVGWASLTHWSERRAYADTAETSFYVHSTHRGRGIGRKLKQSIIQEARQLGFHTLIARVAEGSKESQHLNEEAGFVYVGTLKEVGRKFGKLLDVHIFQKMLHEFRGAHTNSETLREMLRKQPFEPFAIRMTNGDVYEIRHPEIAVVLKTKIIVADPENDRSWTCSLLHIAAIESPLLT